MNSVPIAMTKSAEHGGERVEVYAGDPHEGRRPAGHERYRDDGDERPAPVPVDHEQAHRAGRLSPDLDLLLSVCHLEGGRLRDNALPTMARRSVGHASGSPTPDKERMTGHRAPVSPYFDVCAAPSVIRRG